MPAALAFLTPEQRAQMPVHRDAWIARSLDTSEPDWVSIETGIRRGYAFANLDEPRVIVRCPSPLVVALAGPIAAVVLEEIRTGKKLINRKAVGSAVDSAVGSAVDSAVGSAVGSAVDSAVGSAVDSAVRSAVGSAVDSAVGSAVDSAVRSAVRSAVDSAVRSAVGSAVDSAVRSAVDSALSNQALRESVSWYWYARWGGQYWWSWWMAYASFFRDVCDLKLEGDTWDRLQASMDMNQAGSMALYPSFAMVAERPLVLTRDERGNLHNETGPAMAWRHGFTIHSWHGVQVPPVVITAPETLSPRRINAEVNAEVRRVMIQRFGAERWIRETGATCLHRDDWGELWRAKRTDDTPLVMVKVVNSSPEPDGSYKDYWLRVNPELRPMREDGSLGDPQPLTALNAVASTFGLRGHEYSPAAQS